MSTPEREHLVAIMTALAAGDEAAAVSLYLEFGEPIRRMVVREARRIGVGLTPQDADEMALDFCLALTSRAGAWDPGGGALPWVWGAKLIRQVIQRSLGACWVPLERCAEPPDPGPVEAVCDDHAPHEVLALLARSNPTCRLLQAALERVTKPLEAQVFLAYVVCQRSGDPSPSHTVRDDFNLKPPAVRKTVERVRKRLQALVGTDPVFAPLGGLAILAARPAAA